MDELKPCPFCGGKAKQHLSVLSWVECESCGNKTQQYQFDNQSIDAWNRRAAPENKPLTLEQLWQMEGEPVWVEHFESPCSIKEPGEWLILKSCNPTRTRPYIDFKDKALCAIYYGKGWLAYARKPEQEKKNKQSTYCR